jgi:hypothetical protein
MNEAFVEKLAEAYDFEFEFIFQPLGFLNPNNPFIRDFESYTSSYTCFDLMKKTQQVIRDSIASGALEHFRDFSKEDENCDLCYVDLVHYSGPFNKKLAGKILEN